MVEAAKNWKSLLDDTEKLVASLSKIDAATEVAPRAALAPIRSHVGAIMKTVKARNMNRVGQAQVARDIAFAFNSLNSIDVALATRAMTRNRMAEVLSSVVTKIDNLNTEIRVHVDHKVLQANMTAKSKPARNGSADARKREELEHAARHATSFSSFSEAMRSVLGHVNEVERQEETNEHGSTAVVATAMTEVRERYLFQTIGDDYRFTLSDVQGRLHEFQPRPDAPFMFLRLPVVVISSRQIPVRGLMDAGIKYRVIPFPGIQYGASPGGRREQTDTYGVILDNQLVAAIPNKITGGSSSSLTSQKKAAPAPAVPAAPMGATRTRGAGGPPPPRKVQASQSVTSVDLDLTREQIPAILKMRTGKTYVDVLGTSGTRIHFLTSRQLPGYRFIWYLEQNQYSKMGSLNIREVGLPFKG